MSMCENVKHYKLLYFLETVKINKPRSALTFKSMSDRATISLLNIHPYACSNSDISFDNGGVGKTSSKSSNSFFSG